MVSFFFFFFFLMGSWDGFLGNAIWGGNFDADRKAILRLRHDITLLFLPTFSTASPENTGHLQFLIIRFRITEFHLFLNSTPTKQKQNRHKTHFFKGHRKIGSINQMEAIPHFKFHKPKLIFDIWNEKFSLLIAK